jgi:hypothetical protein
MIKIVYENINEISDSNMKIAYMRNKEKTAYYGNRYGQNIEPSGEYMIMDDLYGERPNNYMLPNYEYGFITFKKPLIIDFIDTTDKGWKRTLYNRYNKTGKQLSRAIMKDGYDGIVTVSNYGIEEIVNLCGNKEITYST